MRLSDRIKISENICQIANLALLPKKDNNPSRRRKIGRTRLRIPIEVSKSESLAAVIRNPHDVSFRTMYGFGHLRPTPIVPEACQFAQVEKNEFSGTIQTSRCYGGDVGDVCITLF